jgi:hypothetical protein
MLAWLMEYAASIDGLRLLAADGSVWPLVLFGAVLVLAAVGLSWHRSLARSRWRAALDAYAERQITQERRRITLKRTHQRKHG